MNPVLLSALILQVPVSPATPEKAVAEVLDTWHLAAARADAVQYFGLMTPDAVFLGTDGSERWDRQAFRVWAEPYFSKGKAWSFRAVRRTVAFSKAGDVAWFEEDLDTPNLGPARGSGVLVRTPKGWRIAQYNLSVPIPNPLMKQVKELIEAHGKKDKKQ